MKAAITMDRWNVIEEIFQSALERPLSERSAYVAQACGDDAELRCEVDSLLASAGNATTTLDQLVAGDLRAMVRSADASEIGLRVGPYRLVRELDAGGMGVVYLAVRSDDQYFQFVAVKMIRRGRESLERFNASVPNGRFLRLWVILTSASFWTAVRRRTAALSS